MKKKGIKVAKKIINFLMVLLILVSFITIGLSVYNLISFNVEAAKYVYFLIGVFLLPYEFLAKGKIDGMFQEQTNCFICALIAIGILLLSIFFLINSAKMFNGKYSSKKRTLAGVLASALIFVFLAWFVLSAVLLSLRYSPIENSLNSVGPEFIKIIKTNFGFNLIMWKEIFIAYFGVIACFIAFVFFIMGISHKSTKVKIVSSINFYSSIYEEKQSDARQKGQPEKPTINQETEIEESNLKAKNLINKIMQLEELKKAGKISNTDYTRLRQKAIKRYKN